MAVAGLTFLGMGGDIVLAAEKPIAREAAPAALSEGMARSPTSGEASAPPSRQGNPLWSIPLASLQATRDRPLFSPTRRPPPTEQSPAALAPAEPPATLVAASVVPDTPPFELMGTVLGGDGDLAVLRSPVNSAITRLRAGQQKEGWRLLRVQGRRIVLEKKGASTTLEMMKPEPAAALPQESESPAGEVAQKSPVIHRQD